MVSLLRLGYEDPMADQQAFPEPQGDLQRLVSELPDYVARVVFPDSVEGLIEVAYTSKVSAALVGSLASIPPGTWLTDERDLWIALGCTPPD
jgi:hypothetical protein